MPGLEEFLFDAGAFAVNGRIGGNVIPTYPVAALTASGGTSAAETKGFNLSANLRIENSKVYTAGVYDPEAKRWTTISVAVLENVTIRDMIQVDRVVARLTAVHSEFGQPEYSTLGTHFENLRIAGAPVEVTFEANIMRPSSREFTFTTLVSEFGGAPEFARDRHGFLIPGFGSLTLAELLSGPDKLSLSMMRLEFDSEERGELELATVMIGSRRLSSPPIRGEKFAKGRSAADTSHTVAERDEEARRIAGLLLEGGRAAAYSRSLAAREIYLADVEMHVDAFQNAAEFLRLGGRSYPCLTAPWLREPIPVFTQVENSLLAAARSDPGLWEVARGAYDSVLRYMEREGFLETGHEARLEMVSVTEAYHHFRRGLEEFLSVRLSARRSNISASAGHVFTVHTKSQGLQICISPAYVLVHGQTFGNQLSTPVTQYVQPGRWIFGAPKLDSRFTYDIPLQNQAHVAR
jgi:hypothetical protein